MLTLRSVSRSGFTIVELLIVIVVIAILAAISIVAYNGITTRANISSANSGLSQINKAVKAFHAGTGAYPSTGGTWVNQSAGTKDTFIPGLVPDYVNSLPRAIQWGGTPTFYYRSADGTDYKLLFLYPSTQTIPADVSGNAAVQPLIDPVRTTRGWGYWTPGAAGY